MPTDEETAENNRNPDVGPKQLIRQESKRTDSGAGGEGKPGQSNVLKNSGLFGFVQFFMDRSDISSLSSGASSPQLTGPGTTPIQVPASDAPAGRSALENSSALPSTDAEVVKNEVFSDGSISDRSDVLRSDSRLERLQSLQSSRIYLKKSEEYRQLFHLPPEEVLVEDFNCALQKKILLQGHIYLFEHYVCFYSNIFGYEKKKVIPLKDITCVRKANTAGVFPNAIEITSWGKKHFFASFLSRDEAYRLIINRWSQHSGYARLFLDSHYSPTSSPRSQSRNSLDSAMTSSTWRSPQRAVSLQPEDNRSRNVEEDKRLVESLIVDDDRDSESLRGLTEPTEGDNPAQGVPDETLGINASSSVSTASISPIWEPEDIDAPGLPHGYKTVVESEFPVDVPEFFHLFFSDAAIGFVKNFHSKCGDDDFRCTQWAKHHHFGHARDISFRHPVNFYFGPKSTYCHESQRFRVYRNSHFVLETSQQMTDIPYGDYFRVEVRWDVERMCGKGNYHCFVRVSLDVTFSKKTVWRGKIEQGTHDESKEAYTVWIREARALLQENQSMFAEAGTVEHPPTASISTTEETFMELTSHGNGSTSSEGGHTLPSTQEEHRKIPEDGEEMLKAVTVGEASQASDSKAGLHGRQWRKKGSRVFGNIMSTSQKIWNKGYNMELIVNRQLRFLCLMLMAILILLMQVGIMIALARASKVQYVSVGYPTAQSTSSMYSGGPKFGDEALTWLEQRTRYLKEEIMYAEARLQTLHQDVNALKMHASHLISYVDDRFSSQHSST